MNEYGGVYGNQQHSKEMNTHVDRSLLHVILIQQKGMSVLRNVNFSGTTGALHSVGVFHVVRPYVELETFRPHDTAQNGACMHSNPHIHVFIRVLVEFGDGCEQNKRKR